MKQKSRIQFMYLKIKIHQTSFQCALQNFMIDVDIAMRIASTRQADPKYRLVTAKSSHNAAGFRKLQKSGFS
jgi:hypothetical protein